MSNRLLHVSIILVLVTLCGCGDGPIDSMTLYALDGTYDPGGDKNPTGQMFNGFPVLGKTDVALAGDRLAIFNAVQKGIADSDGQEPKCFWPRHGVRLKRRGATNEYLICFQCKQLDEYIDGRRTHKLTSDSPRDILDAHLEKAGVPQQKPPR